MLCLKNLRIVLFLFGTFALVTGCGGGGGGGGDSDEAKPTPTPTSNTTTKLDVQVDAPSQFLAFQPTSPAAANGLLANLVGFLIQPSLAAEVLNAQIRVAQIDAEGRVSKIIDAESIPSTSGGYQVTVPGNLRVDQVLVVELNGAGTLQVGQPLPADALVVPTVSANLKLDVASTAALLLLLDETTDFAQVKLSEVKDLLEAAALIALPEPDSGESLADYIQRAKVVVHKALNGIIDVVDTPTVETPQVLSGDYYWDYLELQTHARYNDAGNATSVALAFNPDVRADVQLTPNGNRLNGSYEFLGDSFQRLNFFSNGNRSLEVDESSSSFQDTQSFNFLTDGSLSYSNSLLTSVHASDSRYRVALPRTVKLTPYGKVYAGTSNRQRYEYGLQSDQPVLDKIYLNRIDTTWEVLIAQPESFGSNLVQGNYGQVRLHAELNKAGTTAVKAKVSHRELSVSGSTFSAGNGEGFELGMGDSSVAAGPTPTENATTGSLSIGNVGQLTMTLDNNPLALKGQAGPDGILLYSRGQQVDGNQVIHDLGFAVKLAGSVTNTSLNGANYRAIGLGFKAIDLGGDPSVGVERLLSGNLAFTNSAGTLSASLELNALSSEISTQQSFIQNAGDSASAANGPLSLGNLSLSGSQFSGSLAVGDNTLDYVGYIGADGNDADNLPDVILMQLSVAPQSGSSAGEAWMLVLSPAP